MLRYLAVLAVLAVMLACFTEDVSAVTDQEFQDLQRMMDKMIFKMDHQASEMERQNSEIERQASEMERQASEIERQNSEMEVMASEIHRQAAIIKQLQSNQKIDEKLFNFDEKHVKDLVQNLTVEERVELLEIQVAVIQDEVSDLDEDVDFLFEEQVIQDERLLNLEVENDQTEDEIENLQVTTIELDFRVTELEENGGSDGNSSISELEERVETLEETAADHETRITSTEIDVEDLEGDIVDHETRLVAAEENIQGLQMTDINHDARITELEENGGGGSGSQNETIAFHAVLTSYETIPTNTPVEFNEIVLNQGNGYNSATGVFTVPPGWGGLYYFSTYLLVQAGEAALFDIQLNDDVICTAYGDHSNNGASDAALASCSAVVSVVEGDEVKLVRGTATDDTPLVETTTYYYNGFNGFRI